jgi:hypothetical protein
MLTSNKKNDKMIEETGKQLKEEFEETSVTKFTEKDSKTSQGNVNVNEYLF